MLPASNRGAGSSLNFPDVCKTPAPPAPFIPVPYPNIGLNMQSAPFSPFVSIAFMPATNMATMKVMTTGDEAGAMGGLITGAIKAPGKTTMGNPLVFVTGLPGECLLTPTSGNMMNAPIGAQIVPSVVHVTYTYRDGPGGGVPRAAAGATGAVPPATDGMSAEDLRGLRDVACGEGAAESAARVRGSWLSPGIVLLRVGLFSTHADREVWNALRRFSSDETGSPGTSAIRGVVIDLRGNPGGDAGAALRLAGCFLPRGTVLLRERDSDGDEEAIVVRGDQSYRWPLCVLVDGGSASASELLAATLQHHGRATVIGRPSHGKATAQRPVRAPDGTARYATVAEYLLPDGLPLDGRGLTPDVLIPSPPGGDEPRSSSSGRGDDVWLDAARAVLARGARGARG